MIQVTPLVGWLTVVISRYWFSLYLLSVELTQGGALRILNIATKHIFSTNQSSLLKSIYFPVDQSLCSESVN